MVTAAPTYQQSAIALAEANNVPILLKDQPLAFLIEVWKALPDNELVALVVDRVSYPKPGEKQYIFKSPIWAWKGDNEAPYTERIENARRVNKARYTVDEAGGVFWQGASRLPELISTPKRRGTLDELRAVATFWCDVDCAKEGYSLEEALDALLALKLPPSIVIFSGGGLQAVWLLDAPWWVTNIESQEEYAAYAAALTSDLWTEFGLKIDHSVQEASRMMRMPGFVNPKKGRDGAVARIIYWNPDLRYSPDTFRSELVLPPPEIKIPYVRPEVPGGIYLVSQYFIAYLIDGQRPTLRHPAINHMAWEAAAAGIDSDLFLELVRPVVKTWFAGEGSHRWERELDAQVSFIYRKFEAKAAKEPQPVGDWPVRIMDGHFVKAPDIAIDRSASSTLVIDPPTADFTVNPVNTDISTETGQTIVYDAPQTAPQFEKLDDMRVRQKWEIEHYLGRKTGGTGTIMLLESQPGAGKTYAAYNAAAAVAIRHQAKAQATDPDLFDYKGNVAFLTLFRFEKDDWRNYICSFGIDPDLCFYLTARSPESDSAGYCANFEVAQKVAARGYNVISTVCNICPFMMACKEQAYLSQFPKAERAPILLARHQHAAVEGLTKGRDVIVFDESPNAIVGAALVLRADELQFKIYNTVEATDHPVEAELVNRLAEGFLHIWALTKRPKKGSSEAISYETTEHVQLQGRWFGRMLAWLNNGFPDAAARLAVADDGLIKELCTPVITDLTPAAIDKIPQNWLYYAWKVYAYEYSNRYLMGAKHWNSRIIFAADRMLLYPMEPFAFTRKTKVIVTDATAARWMYHKSFSDKQGNPRQTDIFRANLERRAQIIQYTGTSNSRASIKYGGKSDIGINLDPVYPAAAVPLAAPKKTKKDNAPVAQAKRTIEELAIRHDGSLLVVTYKSFAAVLREWVSKNKILDPNQIQWFGGLAGKNDFKHLSAALIIGTPRIPEVDLFCMAQAWNFDSEIPISTDKKLRILPYAEYADPIDGKGRACQYRGYADERVNDLYLHLILGELYQCYARIREDVSDSPRTVYLGTDFPVANRVNKLISWVGQDLIEVVDELLDKRHTAGQVFKSDLVEEIMLLGRWSRPWVMQTVETAILARGGELALKAAKKSYADLTVEWLENNPDIALRTRLFGTKEWISARKLAALIGNISPTSTGQGINKYWLKHPVGKI